MRVIWVMLGVAGLVTAVAVGVYAELPTEKAKAIEGLIKQLSAKDFKEREAATKKLIEMGPNVVAAVRKELEKTTDPEVKTRCEKVLADVRLVEKKVKSLGKVPEAADVIMVNVDGTRISYLLKSDGKEALWCDGKADKEYDEVAWPLFSGDGKHVAYTARRGDKWFVVKDGEAGPEWDKVDWPTMSRDGKRVMCWAKKDGKTGLVLDGEVVRWYEDVSPASPEFSDDEKHWMYGGERGGKFFMVLDGKELAGYEEVGLFVFSADGKRTAYAAKGEGGWRMVIDGKDEPVFAFVWSCKFSPDGKHIAYRAEKEGFVFMMADGKEGREYDAVSEPLYSRDSRRLAYTAIKRGRQMAVVDNNEEPLFTEVGLSAFSPDSKHVCYEVRSANNDTPAQWSSFVVVDEMQGKDYAEIDSLLPFSNDSRHLCYFARSEGGISAVLDGIEGRKHRWMKLPEACQTVSGKLRYVVEDGGEAWLVEVEWPEGLDWRNGMRPIGDSGK